MSEVVRKANYIGNKRRLAKYIVDKFPEGVKSIVDPMTGVSAVLIEAAKRGMRVMGNDLSIVPYWYSKGVFEGSKLDEADVNRLVGAPAVSGWLTSEWKGTYPRPKEIRRQLDGLAKLARDWQGAKGLAARAVVSSVLQTMYSESGSGYSTRKYESTDSVKRLVNRAAGEINKLLEEVGGKGHVTNEDARTARLPSADVAYFDPPYFRADKGTVHYFQQYRQMNSILLGSEWKLKNMTPEDIPPVLAKLCKAGRHVFVSTATDEVVSYRKELARHKATIKRYQAGYHQPSGFGSRDEDHREHLYVAKSDMLPVDFEYDVVVQKAHEEEGQWIVEGYAATSDFDMQEDIITEEAIRTSAKDLLENSTVLHNHNPNEAIGKVLASEAKKEGLFLKILISKTREDLWQRVKEGVLNKFSVRGKILQARKQWVEQLGRQARLIMKMRLVEVSLVAVPANPKARAIRWYVEKALDQFEKAGGMIPSEEAQDEGDTCEGDFEMSEEVLKGELLEGMDSGTAAGDEQGAAGGEAGGQESGTPGSGDEPAAGGEAAPAGGSGDSSESRKQEPGGGGGGGMGQVLRAITQLMESEQDENRKRVLMQVRGLISRLVQGSSSGQSSQGGQSGQSGQGGGGEQGAEKAGADDSGAGEGGSGDSLLPADLEKAGRKVSAARMSRLKKLLSELQSFIEEVDAATTKKQAEGPAVARELGERVSKIAKALGVTGEGEEIPDLAAEVEKLTKRLDAIEQEPAEKASLEGQEQLAGEGPGKGTLWKNLV